MKGESKKRKEKKIGRKRERIKKKKPTNTKTWYRTDVLQGNRQIFEIASISLQDTKTEKEISYKTKISVVNIAEPCVYNMRYGIIDANEVFKTFN